MPTSSVATSRSAAIHAPQDQGRARRPAWGRRGDAQERTPVMAGGSADVQACPAKTGPEHVPGDAVRRRLLDRADERGESLAGLSAAIGRNAAYLHQFVHRGSPRRLPEDERLLLAMRLQIDERELGARDPWSPADNGSEAA